MRKLTVTSTILLDVDLARDVERIMNGHLANKVSEDQLFETAKRIAEAKGVAEANRWLATARITSFQPTSRTGVINMLLREAINLRREKSGEPSIESAKPALPEAASAPLTAAERKRRADALTLARIRAENPETPVKRSNKKT